MQLKYWLKIFTTIILLFSIVYLFVYAEYIGINHKEHRLVTIMTVGCKMIYRGGSICHAKVKSDDGVIFEGLSHCDTSYIGKKINMTIGRGLFSRKERYYIYCE
ncbi:hypothetical protein L4D00_24020 [Photobacterium swingsii]|uniref:hypothetical protein n=1 Tax=Photobacterium swingsii TaxID=680026 RepID=UPI003D109F20